MPAGCCVSGVYSSSEEREAGNNRGREASTVLHEVAGSSLREIDRLATAALREAARRKKKLVECDVMARVVGELQVDGG